MSDEQVIKLGVSLYREDMTIVEETAERTGIKNVSGTIRHIIRDWQRMKLADDKAWRCVEHEA